MNDILFSSWGGEIIDNRHKDSKDFDPTDHLNLPEYFKQDRKIKAIMGWNGIIMRTVQVDIINLCQTYFEAVLEHAKDCGKCNYCKTGWEEMIEVLQDISNGEATEEDLEFIESAAEAVVDSSKCSIGRSGPTPLFHALKYYADDFSKALGGKKQVTSGTYYSKLTAPCMDACPIHLDIPRYIELVKDAKFVDSLDVIRDRLPLPGVLGRVCFRPCEDYCRRGNVDEPISIKALKRFVADHELSEQQEPKFRVTPSPKCGKVAIVGAGPAGLTCAYQLVRKGHHVSIYEHLSEPGGMSAVGIPDYRLPRPILQREADRIQELGVKIHYNHTIGKDITLTQLENEFDAVFVGIGAQGSLSLGIESKDTKCHGYFPGLVYLKLINEGRDPFPAGKKVVVLGGGNVAIDCVRSALRMRKENVYLVYRRTRNEMPADRVEIHDAKEENVQFHFLTAPVRILTENDSVTGLECIKMELGEPDQSGRPRPVPVPGSEFVFDCDTIVSAIGQQVDISIIEGMKDIQTTRWNTIIADEFTKQSRRPKLFFAGDCESGPDTLIAACAGGRNAANSIDHFINELPLEYSNNYYFHQFFKSVNVYDPKEKIKRAENRARINPAVLAMEKRQSSFDEVEQAFSATEAVAEAERCLRCYQVVTIAV